MTDSPQPLKRGEYVDLDSGIRATRAEEDEPDGLTVVGHGARKHIVGIDRDEIRTLAELVGFKVIDDAE